MKNINCELINTNVLTTYHKVITHPNGFIFKYQLQQLNQEEQQFVLSSIKYLKSEDTFEAEFIAGEYKNKFFITQNHLDRVDPSLMGVEQITPDTLIKPELITSDPHSILMQTRATDKYALAEEMRSYFNNELEINTWGGPLNVLETCAKGVTKASALIYLLDIFQLDAKDLIAFGDEHNDVEMLDLAGKAYGMKNCSDTLRPHADQMTEFANFEDGVAKELEKLFL